MWHKYGSGRTVGSLDKEWQGTMDLVAFSGWISGVRDSMNGMVGMEGWGGWNGLGISEHRD